MLSWIISETIIVALYLLNAALYVRARTRGMTGLRRQQFTTAFWVGGSFICSRRCIWLSTCTSRTRR